MRFLYAFFEVYKVIVYSIRELIWWTYGVLGVDKVRIYPYKDKEFLMARKGFVTKLVFCYSPLRMYRKSFEYKVFDKINNYIVKGDTVVDIGANVGLLTLFMSVVVGDKGHVYSIEASKLNISILKQNLALNNIENVTPISIAVADKPGQLFLQTPKNGYNDALLTISDVKTNTNAEIVEVLPFDKIAEINSMKNIKLIKIDIEGAELLFFKGAEDFFRNNHPYIIFETLEPYANRFQNSVIDVLLVLNTYGYQLTQIDIETWFGVHKSIKNI